MVYFKPSKEFYKDISRLFRVQKARILKLLPFAKIRHIGSTALPDAITKGDLDILVIVPEKYFKKSITKLKTMYSTNQLANWRKISRVLKTIDRLMSHLARSSYRQVLKNMILVSTPIYSGRIARFSINTISLN